MLRLAPVRFTFASVLLVASLGPLVGCGMKSPFEPAFVEVERKKAEEAAAREKAMMEAREGVRSEVMAHYASFRVLAGKAKLMVEDCPELNDENPPRAKGKVLIWDAMEDKLSDAHLRLPADIRATHPEGPISVFLVTAKERRWTRATFAPLNHSGGKPGVQILPTVCLIEMPNGDPVGRAKLRAYEPNFSDANRQWETSNEITGDWPESVMEWAVYLATGKKAQKLSTLPVGN